MTDKTHLDALLEDTSGDIGKVLIAEFVKIVRDLNVSSTSYPIKLRALMDEYLQGADNASH